MRTTPLPHKHRATEPLPLPDRPTTPTTRAHRAARTSDLPIAAVLGIVLVLVAVYFTIRG